ncbi:ethanolamine utilization protein EutP [Aquibacillus halophilus]|uniref:Ethanolamine utilization protein EutP n=1 Tax=Aquibacillus halophilus TaxID=930132 RepID=A0A6A8D693_9BACI|nr:EutP/PduV family microcompartment system protein [Aquibacillus halophilus]MRH41124.1 ethanolamine utilization protein EutP [Aquibacillus halophilus]
MERKVMLIGSIGAGKSTLVKHLLNDKTPASKTQSLDYNDWLIDTPGEYAENPMFYRSLMATSFETALVIMVQDSTNDRNIFPPGFSSGFPVPCIGVITKIDHPDAKVVTAQQILQQSLIQGELWFTSCVTNQGINELRERLWRWRNDK